MPKPTKPAIDLSDRQIARLTAPAEGVDEYRDSHVRGLRLRIYPTGRMIWSLIHRIKDDPKQRRDTIGPYGPFKSAEARIRANEILWDAAHGRDRQAERAALKKAPTFRDIASGPDGWLERYAKPRKRSWKTDEQRLVFPLERWGDHKACDITRRDVVALLDAIVDRGASTQANRTLAVLRTLFRWAVSRDLIPADPTNLVKAPARERQRDRILTADEIRAFWQLTEEWTPSMRGIWRLRLATAQRGHECKQARWADIDVDKRTWTIPAEVSKNGHVHVVPLNDLALEIIAAAKVERDKRRKPSRRKAASEYVFPSRVGGGPIQYLGNADHALKTAGCTWQGHDLRRTAATTMGELGVTRFVQDRVLNHIDASIGGTYDRYEYLAEKRDALERWERRLRELLKGR